MTSKKKNEISSLTDTLENTQPQINIGMFGHVDHGKTTLVKALSGKWTDTHSEEIKRGITIRLGYADISIYTCPTCKSYESFSTTPTCPVCKTKTRFERKISLVDAPGHESLMATMLAGATIIDGALLLISASEECPQPQTREHLMALQILGIENIIVIQSKIDLVSEEKASQHYNQIRSFLKDTKFANAPIIPISGQHNLNLDVLINSIQETIPTPPRDLLANPIMFVARSFDINKPGTAIENLVGGVLGGCVVQGRFCVGDEITICPGYEVEEKNKKVWKPLHTRITDMVTGGQHAQEVIPGGSVALMTILDPAIVKSDKLTGAIVGHANSIPPVWHQLCLELCLLERVVGTKDDIVVEPIKLGEPLMLNVNCAATVGIVLELGKKEILCSLKLPICASKSARVTISRRIGNRFRLIGYGIIK